MIPINSNKTATRLALASGVLILLLGGWYLGYVQKQVDKNQETQVAQDTPDSISQITKDKKERIGKTPTYLVNEIISSDSEIEETGYKTVRNNTCGLTFSIPSDWDVFGFLGESQILSAKNIHDDQIWREANQELIDNAEGDAFGYPQYRSLVIGCHRDIKAYLENTFGYGGSKGYENAKQIEDLLLSEDYYQKNPSFSLVKTISIDGFNAYEMSDTNQIRDEMITAYNIVTEKEEIIYGVWLDHTEYDDLPEEVKQVIDSIRIE